MIIEANHIPLTIVNRDLDLPEIQGDPVLISQEKCKLAAVEVGGPAMVEDTSLCLNALNGMPGPYIKFFLKACGNEGLWNMIKAYSDKTAYAQCCMSFSLGPGCEPVTFVGRTDGTITSPCGAGGFGWDAIFIPRGYDLSFASMPQEEKNKISHRSDALAKFAAYLKENLDALIQQQARC
ncbi:inosine triphosphate pyrophosphatase-like protein [Tribonema minus]|uniref:XTP/dITP diphosphatase n=1 Tax=Tribonema minus TaxID=303371 RepID=A0A836C8S4_9STRA|nr:inosine triphosphate pyrophosphatase-like protein [Tribonema minus]